MAIKRTERGWGAHFVGGCDCLFRRNTLLSSGDRHIVVSTVGAYRGGRSKTITEIGLDRFYETMAFVAEKQGAYLDAVVGKQVCFDSKRWAISALTNDVDNVANDMHEENVDAVAADFDALWEAANKERV